MCAHCFDDLAADGGFLQRLTNTFLIREPAKAIASFYALNPDVTVEEIGLKQLCGIYEKGASRYYRQPETDTTANAPDGDRSGIP